MATYIRVKAAVVDVKQLTLYKEDGTTYEILQGDDRLLPILNEISPIIEAGLIATVDLRIPEVVEDTTFRDFEEHTGGFTRFFRVAKNKVKHLLGLDEDMTRPEAAPVAPVKIMPPAPRPVASPVAEPVAEAPKASAGLTNAISDIMKHAEPVSAPSFKDSETKEDQTIIAVTDNGKGKSTIVPGVENLKQHIAHATKLKDAVGMTAFLQRLGAAIESRDHSVQDVLQFMERGDLPLADDGSIIAYKVLMTKGDDKDLFVDCHTRGVTQRVGSLVCMDIKLVDRNRRESCSYGLHIARRGYLRSFGGNVMVLCKIAPEDVIAVPHGDANKVRVRAYHIISLVPENERQNLRDGKPFQTVEGQRLLTMAIKGDHAPAWQQVEIISHTSTPGGQVRITDLIPQDVAAIAIPQVIKEDVVATPSIPDRVDPAAPKPLDAAPVDPKALAKEIDARKTNVPPTKAEQARVLFNAGKFAELISFKKAAKKSWSALGFRAEEENQINPVKTAPIPAAVIKAAKEKVTNGQRDVRSLKAVDTKLMAETGEVKTTPTKEVKMSGTRAEVARMLFDRAAGGDKSAWGSLWLHQKQAKKSWAILGFTAKEVERIKTNKPDHV